MPLLFKCCGAIFGLLLSSVSVLAEEAAVPPMPPSTEVEPETGASPADTPAEEPPSAKKEPAAEPPSAAEDASANEPAAEEPGLLDKSGEWLESQRDTLSEMFTGSAESIDRYVAGEEYDEAAVNKSYFRLQLRQPIEKSGVQDPELKLKIKLDLPEASRRFKLVFDTSPDDFDTLGEKRRDSVSGSTSAGGLFDEAVGGVSIEQERRVWQRRLDVGVRLGSPINPFTRLRFKREWLLEPWRGETQHTVSYFHEEGAKYEADLEWLRPLAVNFYFKSSSGAQFLDSDNTWELYQSVSVYQRLARRTSLEYQLGTNAFSRPYLRINSYWLRTPLRHLLYKDWLFLNITPELLFAREDDFDPSPSLLIELEVFGHKHGNHDSINSLFRDTER